MGACSNLLFDAIQDLLLEISEEFLLAGEALWEQRIDSEDLGQGDRLVLALTNISPEPMAMSIPLDGSGKDTPLWRNLLDGRSWIQEHGLLSGQLGPYEVAWLVPAAQYTPREEPCA